MQVKWDGQTYDVTIQKKKIPSIKLSVARSGKVFAKVPFNSTEEEIQQYLDEKAEWIAKMVRNAQDSKQKSSSTSSALSSEFPSALGNPDSLPTAVPSKRDLRSGALILQDIRVAVEKKEDAIRTTMHIVAPHYVAVYTPLGTSQSMIAKELKQFLSSLTPGDLEPQLSRREARGARFKKFPCLELATIGHAGIVYFDEIPLRIYVSRRDVPTCMSEAISANEVWFYVPWNVPTKSIRAMVGKHLIDLANAVCEYAYHHGKKPSATFPEVSTKHVTLDGIDYDIEVRREYVDGIELYIKPPDSYVLSVPWVLPYSEVEKWIQRFGMDEDTYQDAPKLPSSGDYQTKNTHGAQDSLPEEMDEDATSVLTIGDFQAKETLVTQDSFPEETDEDTDQDETNLPSLPVPIDAKRAEKTRDAQNSLLPKSQVRPMWKIEHELCRSSKTNKVPMRFLGKDMYAWMAPDDLRFVEEKPDEIIVHGPKPFAVGTKFLAWWDKSLESVLAAYISKWLPVVRPEGLDKIKFALRDMRDNWSRPTRSNRKIHFNRDLLQLPREIIEFVVLLQLVVMIPNRSEEWRETFMDNHMPEWREYARQLD